MPRRTDKRVGVQSPGQLRADTDPTPLLDLLTGTLPLPLLFGRALPRESDADTIVDQVLSGFATA